MVIQLPKPNEIIKPKEINPKFLLLYGSPKIGKTSIIESLDDTYLLVEIDPHGAAYFQGTYIEVNSLVELNEVIQEIKNQNRPYKYVIIDTITELATWMEDYATQMYKNSNLGRNFTGDNVVGDLAKGAGYFWLRRAYSIWFEELKSLADRVIFLGHVKDAALTTKTSDSMGNQVVVEKLGIDEVSTTDLDLTGKLKQITAAQMDAIGYVYRKTVGYDKELKRDISELRVNFNSGSSILGGARPKHLRGVDMKFEWSKIYLSEENEENKDD
jgi:hypothetical protein